MRETRATRRSTTLARSALILLAVLCVLLALSVVPGVRSQAGFAPLWDGWVQCTGYVLAALIAALRVVSRSRHRTLWMLVAVALALRAFAFLWSIVVLPRPIPYPSLADAAWLLSGVLLVGALWLVSRVQLPRLSRTLLLDAILGGLTAAALSIALLYPTLVALTRPGIPSDVVATNIAYPLLDVVQLSLVAGMLATQWRLSRSAMSMSLGILALAVVDGVFLYLVAAGLFRPGTALTPLSLGGTGLIALAAWLPGTPRRAARLEGAAVLVVPALLAVACVGVLAYDATHPVPFLGTAFAAAGIVVAIVRGYVTLNVDRQASAETIAEKDEELLRFRALVDASSDYIGIGTLTGEVLYLNPSARRMTGMTPDEPLEAFTISRALTDEAARHAQEVERPQIMATGAWSGESALRDQTDEGSPIPVYKNTFVIRDEAGAPWLLGTIQRDISELREAQSDIERFSSLVEASNDFIAIASVDGTVVYLNPAGRELVGLGADVDVTTTTITDYLTEEGLRASVEVEQPAVVAHGHWEGESTLRDMRGGPPIPVAISSFLMRHPMTGEPWLLATVQRDISERIAAEQDLRDLADQRQLLLDHLVQAQEDERARIAADVHDDSVQALAAVELRLSLLHRELDSRQPDLLSTVDNLRATVLGATDRLRHLLFDLESPAQRGDLASALAEAASFVLEDAVRWRIEGEGGRDLQPGTRVTAYRVAKEALTNVRKHAAARRVVIGLHDTDEGFELSVTDDGRGFAPGSVVDRPGHLGMPGMRDRAAVAGGRVEITSASDRGTTVRLTIPSAPGTESDGQATSQT